MFKKRSGSKDLEDMLTQIGKFYKEINEKMDRCTERYQDAVKAILDQFPITMSVGVDGSSVFLIGKKKVSELREILEALKEYIAKFESIIYLDFLSEENRNVVFVGPNGCGKTTLLRKVFLFHSQFSSSVIIEQRTSSSAF